MKKALQRIANGQRGQVLPVVLALMVVGTLVAMPTLDYVTTSLKAGETIETNVEAMYAADAGIEDAVWKLSHDPWEGDSKYFPKIYTLPNAINGMSVDVTIDFAQLLGDKDRVFTVHQDWLIIDKTVSPYNEADHSYEYTLSVTDWDTASQIFLQKVVLDLTAGISYRPGTTTGNITSQDPVVTGGEQSAPLMLTWEFDPKFPMQKPDPHYGPFTYTISFTLEAAAPVSIAGYHYLTVGRQDIGTITDYWPFAITSIARDAAGEQAQIRAGVLFNQDIYLRSWQIYP